MSKISIAIAAHKPVNYGIWNDDIYTPIQVGYGERFLDTRDDDDKDNISQWNNVFWENTAFYYWWHNHPKDADYVGQCQYRKRMDVRDVDVDKIFESHDIICASPLVFYPDFNPKSQYEMYHNAKDWEVMESTVKSLYPDYADSFDRFLNNGNVLFYSNGFITKREDYDKYCEWLFTILFEVMNRLGFKTPSDVEEYVRKGIESGECGDKNGVGESENALWYQQAIFGFMSERLFTLYVFHNFDTTRIFVKRYAKMEDNI